MSKVITNPDDPSQTYTVGQRGRKPLWYKKLIGENTSKPVDKKDRVVKKLKPRTGKEVKYSNCSLMVNGKFYYAGKDSTMIFDEADEIVVLCKG